MREGAAMQVGMAAVVVLLAGLAMGFQAGVQASEDLRGFSGAVTVVGSLLGLGAVIMLLKQAFGRTETVAASPSLRQ